MKKTKKWCKLFFAVCMVIMVLLNCFSIVSSAITEYEYGNYTYSVTDGKATIIAYSETASGDVIVPETINGYTVDTIGYQAFYACTVIRSVKLPQTVTSIQSYAFAFCMSMQTITIPSSVKFIGDHVFQNTFDIEIQCPSGSYAQAYAARNGYTVILIPEDNGYNLGEETYSFENFSDGDSNGHCFGMSMTSAGYYTGNLNTSVISLGTNTLFSRSDSEEIRRPICHYQHLQGSRSDAAIVAGGSYYLRNVYDIASDWEEVVRYVQSHTHDATGGLQIGFRKRNEGGHAINFLRYEIVNGQVRIYAYDNNFPNVETYFYQTSDGRVFQEPRNTFSGSIDCIALRSVDTYFSIADGDDTTHNFTAQRDNILVHGANSYPIDTDVKRAEYVVFEVREDLSTVQIKPLKDGAEFEYMGKRYKFGSIDKDTYATIVLASVDDSGEVIEGPVFEIHDAPPISIRNYCERYVSDYKTTITFSYEGTVSDNCNVYWFINGVNKGASQTFTVEKAKKDYTVQIKVISEDGEIVDESEIETVIVKHGLFDRLIAFFRSLFHSLPVVVQEHMGIEALEEK